MPFMRAKSIAKKCYFTVFKENKSPTNVCGTQIGKIRIYVRKGEKQAQGREKERGETTASGRKGGGSQFQVVCDRIASPQVQELFFFLFSLLLGMKNVPNNTWFVIFRAHSIQFIYFSTKWLVFNLFLHGCYSATWV